MASLPTLLAGYGAAKTLFAGKPKAPPAVPMPDFEALQRAKKRSVAARPSTGAASTILTGTPDGLGG